MNRLPAAALAGIVGGLAYFGHAMVQNSHAWPLLWTFFAGLLAVIIAGRDSVRGAGSAIGLGALAGFIAGLLFLLASSIALFALGVPHEAARELQENESAALLGLAVAAALAVIPAAIGAAVSHLVLRGRS